MSNTGQVLQAAVPRHIPANPAAKPVGQRKGNLPKIKRYRACFLTPEEGGMIIRAAEPQIVDLIRTALGTGLRLGELLGLRVQDVDLEAKTPRPPRRTVAQARRHIRVAEV